MEVSFQKIPVAAQQARKQPEEILVTRERQQAIVDQRHVQLADTVHQAEMEAYGRHSRVPTPGKRVQWQHHQDTDIQTASADWWPQQQHTLQMYAQSTY